ncbi:hypothetical protein [Gloeothece verrucosa]|uniref:Uncharacterized protein n=1 Tax=Gloeothece verrucosa (strain PCC 7822) TaxID=497965 RepID=E0UHS7_GLOV7|nr:hypothetical protein [Gloeothece verrucosa]ADN13334.1 conserved hypothetical protein [Gloeothece verrucosa PCC 7822]
MADIKINDIKPAGAELFEDSEGFLNELKDDEVNKVVGGVGTVIGRCCSNTAWTIIGKCGNA